MEKIDHIAFVCLHGSAKSLIAAEHCMRLAARRGLVVETTSSGPEPDREVPPEVVAGLLAEGIDVRGRRPARVTSQRLAHATRIVSFGCALDSLAPSAIAIERWDDCPAVSDDYETARDFIVARVRALVEGL